MRLLPGGSKIRLTEDDFDVITDHGRLLDEGGEFDRLAFRQVCVHVCVWVCGCLGV